MKRVINGIILTFLIFILFGCTPSPEVRFLDPQPIKKRDLKSIPKRFQGKYLCISDSSILTIDSKLMLQELETFTIISDSMMYDEFDTIYEIDQKIEISDNYFLYIDVEDDSTVVESYRIDTLFDLSINSKLRNFKGYLFLNYLMSDSTWRVKLLKLKNGQLEFDNLIDVSQIDTLKQIINIEIDTTSNHIGHYDLSPKKREVKQIIKRQKRGSKFIKIKN